ncbi:MAG: hypothetical protein KDK33_15880 [Leptospiraceae bacterium]|nr:hypothetical protein [Leptospiraceae bacterium]
MVQSLLRFRFVFVIFFGVSLTAVAIFGEEDRKNRDPAEVCKAILLRQDELRTLGKLERNTMRIPIWSPKGFEGLAACSIDFIFDSPDPEKLHSIEVYVPLTGKADQVIANLHGALALRPANPSEQSFFRSGDLYAEEHPDDPKVYSVIIIRKHKDFVVLFTYLQFSETAIDKSRIHFKYPDGWEDLLKEFE